MEVILWELQKKLKWKIWTNGVYGAVVPNVYNEYKYTSGNELSFNPELEKEFCKEYEPFGFVNTYKAYKKVEEDLEATEIIDETIEMLSNLTDWDLVNITRSYDVWKKAYEEKTYLMLKEDIKRYHKDVIKGFNSPFLIFCIFSLATLIASEICSYPSILE